MHQTRDAEDTGSLPWLTVLQRVAAVLTTEQAVDPLLTAVLHAAAALVRADAGMIALVAADRQSIRGRVGWQVPLGLLAATVRPLFAAPDPAEDLYALVVRTGEQLVAGDDHPALHTATTRRFGLTHRQRVLTPICHVERVIGVLGLTWRHDRVPSADDLTVLRLIAAQVGGAIAQAERVVQEQALRGQLDSALHASGTVVFGYGQEGRMDSVVGDAQRLLGQPVAALLGRPVLDLVHPSVRAAVAARLAALLAGEMATAAHDTALQHADGHAVPVHLVVGPRLAGGRVVGGAGAVTDRTTIRALEHERERARQQLRRAASRDPLTALPNRSCCAHWLAVALQQPPLGPRYAVLVLNLDHFKQVNDSLGHRAGNALLLVVAHRLAGAVRRTDRLAHFGGDTFALLLAPPADVPEAQRVAGRLHAALAAPFPLGQGEQPLRTSVGIGIALDHPEHHEPEDVLRAAEVALDRAKLLGPGQQVVFAAAMHSDAVARLQLDQGLRRALAAQEFRLVYQPIVALATGAIVAVEALLRWPQPGRDELGPAQFLPVAEAAGLMPALGRWVLEEASRQLAAWRQVLPQTSDLAMSVNLSACQLEAPAFLAHLDGVLERTAVPPERLWLELTEQTMLTPGVAVEQTLAGLWARGIPVLLDDFGTGYSSLSLLTRLPVTMLKIEQGFIQHMTDALPDRLLVEAVLLLTARLGMLVVAEGVETPVQRALLCELGCTYEQGYLFSKPLSPGAMGRLLANQRASR